MKTRRLTSTPLLRFGLLCLAVTLGLSLSAPFARGQAVYLDCQNDYKNFFNMPIFPQILNANIVILTDAATPAGNHGITVVNTDTSNNVALFNFNVGAGGQIVGQTSTAIPYGQSPSGTQQKSFSTVIGTYTFAGDNFPLSAWPSQSNWQAPPVIDHRQFNLDQGIGWAATQTNSKNLTIQSDYHYQKWAWATFLGYQLPYIPGASAAAPIGTSITFDLRGYPPSPTPPPTQTVKPSFIHPIGGTCKCCGMAVASLDRFQAGIAITDTPVSYTPGVGRDMSLTLSYSQRLTNQPSSFNFSNVGPQWSSNWITYIEGGPANGLSDAIYHSANGGQYAYGGYERTVVQGSGTELNQGDFQANDGWTHSTLHYRQNPERYERWLPDGSVEIYAQAAGVTANQRFFFLTQITDPQNNTTTLAYDSTAAANGQAVLVSVTDPTGGKLNFTYNTGNPLQIAKVTRSNDGNSAYFQYNSSGQLTSITDTIGMTSSFQYASGTNFINQMTTPYGKTSFNSSDTLTMLEADMTGPTPVNETGLNQTERVEYQESLSSTLMPVDASLPTAATGFSMDTANLNQVNSFYWSRREYADGGTVDSAGFYAKAEISHWAETPTGSIPVPLSTKKPLEGRVCYNYPGQTSSTIDYLNMAAANASTGPSVTARVMDGTGNPLQVSYASYNNNGAVTKTVDPIGRTTNYTYWPSTNPYSANGIDLYQVTQTNGSNQDVLSAMSNYVQHEPQTVVDAAGQTTTLAYNGVGQLTSRTVVVNGANQITTLAYYPSTDYLHTVTGPISGAVTTYAYDAAGRVSSVMDSEGYTIQTSYDNLDRPTTTTYPDGTTDQTIYNKLDVDHTIDRKSRVTQNSYDAIRELVLTTDPLGRTTKYTWCLCGGLATLTDANGNVTTWGLDSQGRVISKTYADTSAINYVYESNMSRLHTMTDAKGNIATYSYNSDNTLAGVVYTAGSGSSSTPSVGFTYDPIYNRVHTMNDGTGTTTYTYNPMGALGGGRLAGVTVPIAGTSSTASVTYTKSPGVMGYDELGRVVGRGVDQGSTNANNVLSTFDALGRVTGVTNTLGAFGYTYVNETSRLQTVTYPSGTGLSTNYSYFPSTDTQNWERLQDITNTKSGTSISKFDYTYNVVGTIATWIQQADSSAAITNTLGYDNADQLNSAVQSGGATATNTYHYDPAGNRLAEITATGTTAGQFNKLNQLTGLSSSTTSQTVSGQTSGPVSSVTVNGITLTPGSGITGGTNFSTSVALPSGTNVVSIVAQPSASPSAPTTQRYQVVVSGTTPPLTYDLNGNITTDELGNTYTWDALNRLSSISYHAGGSSTFAYDGLSRRVQIVDTTSGGTVTTKNYLWIGQEIAEERNTSNTVTKRFFPQGEQQSSTNYYYTRDHLGSVREMLNGSGAIVARYSYDPYGRTTLVSGSNLATKQYTGNYYHATSGLNLTKYRAYDPNTGRWLSRDPIGERGGSDLYDYAENDPTDLVDTLGLMPCENEARELAVAQGQVKEVNQELVNTNALIKQVFDLAQYGGPSRNAMNKILAQLSARLTLVYRARVEVNARLLAAQEAWRECMRKNPPPGGNTPCPNPAPSPAPNSTPVPLPPSPFMPTPFTPAPNLPPTAIPSTEEIPLEMKIDMEDDLLIL